MSALRAIRPATRAMPRAVAPRSANNMMAPRRFFADAPKPGPSGPNAGAPPGPSVSGVKGTVPMLGWSVVGIVAATGAFLYLGREDKKTALGVGTADGVSKTKGAKHKAGSSGASASASDLVAGTKADYQKVYNAIADRLEQEGYDDGSYGPVLVRLAWHSSGTYCKDTKTGGSNGATMRFAPESDHGANAGLKAARDFLEPVKAAFPWVTYSDLWTLAGVVAVQEMGGPLIPWRPGRSDREQEHCAPDGRLPDGDKEQDHLRFIFYRMGFNDQEIVALSGAHALGRCHTDRSGFEGPWTHSPISFTNQYYDLLLNEKWNFKKWEGPKQYIDKSTGGLMMLTTDMALIKDKAFRPWVEKYAKDEEAFFKDFSGVFAKLLELGVPEENFKAAEADHSGKPYTLKSTADQENSSN